jgi:hypothetical protein
VVRHVVRGPQVAQSTLGPINKGLPSIQTTCSYFYKLVLSLFERLNEGERETFEENHEDPSMRLAGGRLRWPKAGAAPPNS